MCIALKSACDMQMEMEPVDFHAISLNGNIIYYCRASLWVRDTDTVQVSQCDASSATASTVSASVVSMGPQLASKPANYSVSKETVASA